MNTILTTVFLFLALSFAHAHNEGADTPPSFLRLFTYEQGQNLREDSRNSYMQSVAQVLVALSEDKPRKISFFEELLSMGSIAYASPLYQCIGGGVPVDGKSSSCGVQSYAGFTCKSGNICNPLVFGVSASGEPVCHANATTKWCFDNTKLGQTQFLGPVFKTNKVEQWNKLRDQLQQACNNPSSVRESRQEVASACGYVRQQMEVNENIRKLMSKGYTYKVEAMNVGHCHSCAQHGGSNIHDLASLGAVAAKATGFYPHQHRFEGNGQTVTIAGVKGQLVSPMPGCNAPGGRSGYTRRGSIFHAAQDLTAYYGAPVVSVAPGVVVASRYGGDGYGNSVVVMHKTNNGEVFYSGYHHLASRKLQPGTKVAAGATLGTMGSTGLSTGPHLHFEIMDRNQRRSNPAAYYPQGICSPNSVNAPNLASL